MGLFWGNDAPTKPKKPEPPRDSKYTHDPTDPDTWEDPCERPISGGYLGYYNGINDRGNIELTPGLQYVIRQIQCWTGFNNKMIHQLLKENQELREQLNRIEQKIDMQNRIERAI